MQAKHSLIEELLKEREILSKENAWLKEQNKDQETLILLK
jgi:hypothetical protein